MTVKASNSQINQSEQVVQVDEDHRHTCVDEITSGIKAHMDEIYWFWNVFELRCDDVLGPDILQDDATSLMDIYHKVQNVHAQIKALATKANDGTKGEVCSYCKGAGERLPYDGATEKQECAHCKGLGRIEKG